MDRNTSVHFFYLRISGCLSFFENRYPQSNSMASSNATRSGSSDSLSFLILLTHLPSLRSSSHLTGTLVCPYFCLKAVSRPYISFQGTTFLRVRLQSNPIPSNNSTF